MSADDDNVRVIVRVRPLNKREKESVSLQLPAHFVLTIMVCVHARMLCVNLFLAQGAQDYVRCVGERSVQVRSSSATAIIGGAYPSIISRLPNHAQLPVS
jgi:hypothetical protein